MWYTQLESPYQIARTNPFFLRIPPGTDKLAAL